jgi:hypothetical protein
MTELFGWTTLFPIRTGLPVTIWVNIDGPVATDPYQPEDASHRSEVAAWVTLNADVLAEHWAGQTDGVEMGTRTKKVP